jgi:hypothetical protein
MSEQFSKLTWLSGLTGADLTDGEYRVLVAIFNHTDESGQRCYAKQTTLAAETGRSDRQVRRIIPELIRKGWLVEVRKGSGRAGLSSEFNLSTPEYRTPVSAIPDASPKQIPDTHDRYSEGIPDISGMNTGHLEQEYRTFGAQIPDTYVLPTDPLSDPATEPDQVRDGEDDRQGESEPDVYESVSSSDPGIPERDIFSGVPEPASWIGITDPFTGEAEPQAEAEPMPWDEPTECIIRWPAGEPLPQPRDPFATYVDQTTGEQLWPA